MDFLKSIGKDLYKDFAGKGDSGSGETYYITAIRAEGIKNKDRFTKSDPYLTIHFGSKSVRTRTINNDLSPHWNETFSFNGRSKDIKLKLKDDDVGLDDTIGTAIVSGGELPMYNGEEKYLQIPVTKNEEIHGVIHLKIKKVGGANPPSSSYQQSTYTQSTNYPPQQQYQQHHQSYPQQQPSYQQPPSYQQQPYQQQYQQPYPQSNPPQSQMYPQNNYQQPPPYQNNAPYGQQSNYPQQSYPYTNQNPQYYNKQPYNQYNQQYR